MIELELLGVDSTGDRLVLVNAEGERFTLEIDDSLRATVRRSRPTLVAKPSAGMRPKEIQTLLRAGATPAEVAQASGMAQEMVEKFAAPVRGEQAWAVERAQNCRVGHDADAPTLGDLVVDRLAARAVDPSSLQWDAIRRGGEPWEVFVTFVQAAEEREARWSVDLSTGSVRGLNDQARWLTETSTPGPLPAGLRSHSPGPHTPATPGAGLPGVAPHLPGPGSKAEASVSQLRPPAADSTQELLDHLDRARGRRSWEQPPPGLSDSGDAAQVLTLPRRNDEGSQSAKTHLVDDAQRGMSAHPAGAEPGHVSTAGIEPAEGTDSADSGGNKGRAGNASNRAPKAPAEPTLFGESQLSAAEGSVAPQAPAMPKVEQSEEAEKPKRGARRSIPTWDEIVFGSRR